MWRWLPLAAWALAGAAMGQTTAYGLLGAALRSSTNVTPQGSGALEMTGSNVGAGVLGLRGSDSLDGGLQIHYKLEAGYFLDTGIQRNNGIFGREAMLGLSGAFGRLELGRLQFTGLTSETLVRADPLRGAGQFETVWPGIWTGARSDRAWRYRYTRGPWFAGVFGSVGEPGKARTQALSGGYQGDRTTAIATLQTLRDGSGLHSTVLTAGVTAPMGASTLHLAYLHARRDSGFLVGAASGVGLFNSDLGFAGIKAPADQDTQVGLLGATVPLGGNWRLRSAVFFGHSPHATLFSAKQGGRQRTAYALLSYDFSKRTSLLLEADFNHWSGGWGRYFGASAASLAAYRPDGFDSRRTASIGLLHSF